MIDCIEPCEIKELYVPNKHGIVFKELIYVPELSWTSMEISLKSQQCLDKLSDDVEIRMKLEVIYEDEMIFSKDFFNKIIIENLILKGKVIAPPQPVGKQQAKEKKEKEVIINPPSENINHPYYITCYLDLSETPSNLIKASDYQSNFFWKIRIFSSDSVAFVKNCIQENMEKAVIQGWEDEEPGRAQRAKGTRAQYLLWEKKKNGNELTEEEEIIVKRNRRNLVAKRPTIITSLQRDMKKENTNTTARVNKSMLEYQKIDELPMINEYQINFEKILPGKDSYQSLFLKNFLKYLNSERTVQINTHRLPSIDFQYCRTGEESDKEKEDIIHKFEEFNERRKKEESDNQLEMKRMASEKARITEKGLLKRNKYKKVYEKLIKKRQNLKECCTQNVNGL